MASFQHWILCKPFFASEKPLHCMATERSSGLAQELMWTSGNPHIFLVQEEMLWALPGEASVFPLC